MPNDTPTPATAVAPAVIVAPTKPWWQSKTIWLNLIALLSLMAPAVRQWIAANPVEVTAAISSLGVLLRFATSGKVHWLSDDSGDQSGNGDFLSDTDNVFPDPRVGTREDSSRRVLGVPWLVALASVAMLLSPFLLGSCSQDQIAAAKSVPITIGVEGEYGSYAYSSKGGLSIAIKGAKVTEQKSLRAPSPGIKRIAPKRWDDVFTWCDPRRQLKERRMCHAGAGGEETDGDTGILEWATLSPTRPF